jgi:hypothetical protein
MEIQKLPETLRRDFLVAIAMDTTLNKEAFLNRVIDSINKNGVEFTAEIYDLTEELVTAISDLGVSNE